MIRARLKWRLEPIAGRFASWLGFDLVRRTPYSPVPDVPGPEAAAWSRPSALAGWSLDLERQLTRVEERLAPWFAEIAPPRIPPFGVKLDNGYFAGLDALLLWATLRELRPARVLELGAGHSTLFVLGALDANGTGTLTSVDPSPRLPASALAHPRLTLEQRSANETPLASFVELSAGDVLFVDTTHTVKRGSEVNRLILDVLPRLAAGVVVQIHDVFLPWDYPRQWFVRGTYLAEQYLVQAYLAENPHWEVLAASQALWRTAGERLRRLAPDVDLVPRPGHGASSLWLRRLPER